MTKTRRHHRRPRPKTRAFTLIELMIVVGIIAVLAALGIASFARGRALVRKAAMRTLIAGLEMGVNQYRSDLGDYPPSFGLSPRWDPPPSTTDWTGAHWLTHASLALGDVPVDGYDGPGLRVQRRGTVYGPYVDVDRAKTEVIGPAAVLIDDGDNPILYYRLDPTTGLYNSLHNELSGIAGPTDDSGNPDINAYAELGSTAGNRPPFIICSMGQDGEWGDDFEDDGQPDALGDDYTNLSE